MADKTTESVEDCLKELKTLFPSAYYRRIIVQEWPQHRPVYPDKISANVEIRVWGTRSPTEPQMDWNGNTLNEAMQQVRQWHAEQAKES